MFRLKNKQIKQTITNNNNLHLLSKNCRPFTLCLRKETLLSREDLNNILEQCLNPELLTKGKEVVL